MASRKEVSTVNLYGEYEYKTDGTIKVGEGFFVKLAANYASLTYNHNAKSTRSQESFNSLNIIATGNTGKDNVIINMGGEKAGFNKLQNFNANKMGNYTISIEPDGKFQTVTLVDRFTGIETNMLLEDYHFTAMGGANNNRFIVKMVNSQRSTVYSQRSTVNRGLSLRQVQ